MDHTKQRRKQARFKRVMRVRKKVKGTAEKPRLSVSKTLKHIYVQLIDDAKGITLCGFGTMGKKGQKKSKESAAWVGTQIAELAKKQNIEEVVFDRGRYKYHGLIAALADKAREAGLKF